MAWFNCLLHRASSRGADHQQAPRQRWQLVIAVYIQEVMLFSTSELSRYGGILLDTTVFSQIIAFLIGFALQLTFFFYGSTIRLQIGAIGSMIIALRFIKVRLDRYESLLQAREREVLSELPRFAQIFSLGRHLGKP